MYTGLAHARTNTHAHAHTHNTLKQLEESCQPVGHPARAQQHFAYELRWRLKRCVLSAFLKDGVESMERM